MYIMKLLLIILVISIPVLSQTNLQNEVRNFLDILSLFDIKPESYMKISTNLNEKQCNQDIGKIFADAFKNEMYALKMLDSTAKIHEGLLTANRIFHGDFDQCLEIKVPHNFQPQYCLLSINVSRFEAKDVVKSFRYPDANSGFCLPSSCPPKYIERVLRNIQFPYWGKNLTDEVAVRVIEEDCVQPNDSTKFTVYNWLTISFCVVIVLCVALSTLYEVVNPNNKLSLWTAFSLLTTGREIFGTEDKTGLKGFRGLLSIVVVYGHYTIQIPNGNLADITFCKKYADSVALQATFTSLEGFIVLSGIFTVTAFYNEVSKKKSYDPLLAIIKRYLKLILPVLVIYLLRTGIFEHLYRGPIYKMMHRYQTRSCSKSIWPILLAVENFFSPRIIDACFQHTWYISLDLQLFVITQVFLIASIRRPKLLYQIAIVCCLTCGFISFYLSYTLNLGYTPASTAGYNFFDYYVFQAPHTRGIAWFAGTLWAGFLVTNQGTDFSKRKRFQKIMWVITALCYYYSWEWVRHRVYEQHTQPGAAIYWTLHQFATSIAFGWIINALIFNLAGPLRVILSWGPFNFLGELSHETYMIHLMVIDFILAISRNQMYLTFNKFWYHVIAIMGYSTLAALVFAICITRPLSNLIRLATNNKSVLPIAFKDTEQTRTSNHAKSV